MTRTPADTIHYSDCLCNSRPVYFKGIHPIATLFLGPGNVANSEALPVESSVGEREITPRPSTVCRRTGRAGASALTGEIGGDIFAAVVGTSSSSGFRVSIGL